MSMRLLLGTLGLLLVLAGCGSDTGSAGSGGATDDQDPSAAPSVGATTVTLVSATSGHGDPATRASFLASDAALASYVQQFDEPFAAVVTDAAEGIEVDDGEVLIAQVVSIGCDKPLDAGVREFQDGVAIVPTPVPTPHLECVAPVTTVGLAAVPVSLEGGGR